MRHPIRLTLLAAGLAAAAGAHAQNYPARPVRMIVPAAPGGGADIVARIVAIKLTELLGQQVVVDNRAGAAGTIGAEMTARAVADGYTVLMAQSTSVAIAPNLYPKLGYDTLRDFAPISLSAAVPNLVVVHPSIPVTTIKELIAFAKAKPGQLNYGSSGTGAPSHLAGELLKSLAGAQLTHIPYKGAGPATASLLGAETQVMFAPIVAVIPHVKSNRLRAVAVTTAKRSPAVPEIPTVAESGVPGYEIASWFGVLGPAKLPPEIVARLNRDLVRAVQAPETKERLANEGAEAIGSTPAQFTAYLREELARYGKLIRDAGIRAD
ncbi:MAG: Bug family tripartite tricarboxylate transporter substrate binding protein [Burkholderiales bacterium]